MYCENCGAEIDNNAIVCVHCGAQTSNFKNKTTTQYNPPASAPLGVASLVCGIASLVLAFLFCWAGIASAIVAIVLSVQSKNKEGPNGKATAGLVTGIIGLIIAGIFIIIFVIILNSLGGLLTLQRAYYYYN